MISKQRTAPVDFRTWLENCQNSDPAIIDQILPEDVGEFIMLSGRTGIGKSVLSMHMAFCLATGTSFMGLTTQRVVVGFLAMEGGRDNIKDRFLKIEQLYPNTDGNLRFDLQTAIDLPRHQKTFIDMFRGCQVVILDNLRQVTSGRYLDNTYAAEWVRDYQAFLTEIGAVGILTHHIKKPNTASLISPEDFGDVYNLKGATEYVDASTTVLLLERKRQGHQSGGGFAPIDKNALVLHFAKARIATRDLEPIELRRNYDRCGFDMAETVEMRVAA